MELDTELPLVVAGNGPSLKEIVAENLPEEYVLFRCNFFFLDKESPLKTHVDAHFSSVKRLSIFDGLNRSILKGNFSVQKLFFVNSYTDSEKKAYSDNFVDLMNDAEDHWSLIATNPVLARAMMSRPLPTQCFQMAAVGAVCGFKEIHYVGIDLYSGHSRYAYEVPAKLQKELGAKHSTDNSYEQGAHTLSKDLDFLSLINEEFKIKMINHSRMSPLSQLIRTI